MVEEFDKAGFARLYNCLYLAIAFNSKWYAFVNLVGSTAGKSLLGVLMGRASAPFEIQLSEAEDIWKAVHMF